METYGAEDLVIRHPDGKKQSRDEAIAALDAPAMAMARFVDSNVKITSVTMKGKEAIVLYKDQVTASLEGDGEKPQKVVHVTSGRDTWVKTAQGWRTRRSDILSAKTLVDGKPMRQ